ncbi:hypothetical protein NE237_009943 [Protea cynaroides]|uniref:Late embryogenesis abundant protein LEA-2 subgroup domain-containing protein n=1 Tax=Protea cynaroides TaxID=273540 RepID=A0A9Q0KYE2_9MAGN|nr:hypothetical protein NE237_009943 [Protea cynaroides]
MYQTKVSCPPNGAYYGHPIHPQPQPVHHRHPLYNLFLTIIKVMFAIVILLGTASFIFRLLVRPPEVKFYVVTADLTQFELTNGSTLNYNLSLNMTVRNPNKKIGIYYDTLYATASYNYERFSWDFLQPFYQEKKAGFFYIDVKVYAGMIFKIGSVKTRRHWPDIECYLRVPLTSNGTIAGEFESTRSIKRISHVAGGVSDTTPDQVHTCWVRRQTKKNQGTTEETDVALRRSISGKHKPCHLKDYVRSRLCR